MGSASAATGATSLALLAQLRPLLRGTFAGLDLVPSALALGPLLTAPAPVPRAPRRRRRGGAGRGLAVVVGGVGPGGLQRAVEGHERGDGALRRPAGQGVVDRVEPRRAEQLGGALPLGGAGLEDVDVRADREQAAPGVLAAQDHPHLLGQPRERLLA